ncbi:unnamed protein product [Urochloa humidicola]
MRKTPALVREAAAEHFEERQADWAYSCPGCNFGFSDDYLATSDPTPKTSPPATALPLLQE